MSNISLNYAQIIDPLSFKSINLAKIYIGEYGTLPNPANVATWKQAYFVNSDGTRTAASQPIRTNAAGFAVDGSGNIKTIQVDGGYSLLVHDQYGATKFSQACSTVNSGAVLEFDTIAGFTGAPDGSVCYFKGRDTVGDGGGGHLRFLAGSTATANGGTVYAVTGGRLVRDGFSTVDARWFGAKLDGDADDTDAFLAAGATGFPVLVSGEKTKLSADIAGDFFAFGNVAIAGTGYANVKDMSKDVRKPDESPIGRIEIIAHRGFSAQAPQNTMLAYSTALSRGADSLELDLQVSSDGVIYAFHDTTVDALTNGTGTFTSLSSATIDGLTFDSTVGTPFADEGIPRFTEVLKLARLNGVKIYPEMKNVWSEAQMLALLSLLDSYGFNNDRCCIQASSIVYCEQLRTLSPSVGICYVGAGSFASVTPFVDRLKAINGALAWNMDDLLFQPEIITYCYSKGVDVVAWTIASADKVKKLASIGVRKVMADNSVGGSV